MFTGEPLVGWFVASGYGGLGGGNTLPCRGAEGCSVVSHDDGAFSIKVFSMIFDLTILFVGFQALQVGRFTGGYTQFLQYHLKYFSIAADGLRLLLDFNTMRVSFAMENIKSYIQY